MNPPVLETIDLRMTYQLSSGMFRQLVGGKGRSVRAVDGVSIAIPEGETLAVVGESGSGQDDPRPPRHPAGGTDRRRDQVRGQADGQPRAAGAQGLSKIGPDDLPEPLRGARSALSPSAMPSPSHSRSTGSARARSGAPRWMPPSLRSNCGRRMSSHSVSLPICRAANYSAWRSRAHWFSNRGCSLRTSR